jgi:hypothetical protein
MFNFLFGDVLMLKKFSFICFLATTALSTHAYATIHPLEAQLTLEYTLVPNEGEVFINYMFWHVDVNCTVKSMDDTDLLHVVGLAKKGQVNNIPLAAGDSLNVTVQNGDVLKLGADSGAKVEITNLGKHNVVASCSPQ